jgi:hypothetical protein
MDNQEQQLKDAFLQLPEVLQKAITNADVQANLRKLANTHKLHLDKWVILENEIMMALLGLTDPNDLPRNISEQILIPIEQAREITDSVTKIVFDPIQEELQREIGESQSTLETIDTPQAPAEAIDISKFSPAHSEPSMYNPKTEKKYVDNNDPYHEAIE